MWLHISCIATQVLSELPCNGTGALEPYFYTTFFDYNGVETAMALQYCVVCGGNQHYEIRFFEDFTPASSTLGIILYCIELLLSQLSSDEVMAYAVACAACPPPPPMPRWTRRGNSL